MDRDFRLVWKMKQGDEAAMNEFVNRYYDRILSYCNYHCLDRQASRDLTQETFTRFFCALADYQSRGKAINYLYVIARNVCIDHTRKKSDYTMDELPEKPVDSMEGLELKLDIQTALAELPEEFREIIILHIFQQLSLRETAEIAHIGVPLAKYRLKRAKEQLKLLLGREED